MAKLKKKITNGRSNKSQLNIKECYVSIGKLDLNKDKTSHNTTDINKHENYQNGVPESSKINKAQIRKYRDKYLKEKLNTKIDEEMGQGHYKPENSETTNFTNKENLTSNQIDMHIEKNQAEVIRNLKNKYNINKEIKIKLTKIEPENEVAPVLNTVINSNKNILQSEFSDNIEENQNNINKRTLRSKIVKINNEKKIQTMNKKKQQLALENEKIMLRNGKQNKFNHIGIEKHIVTRRSLRKTLADSNQKSTILKAKHVLKKNNPHTITTKPKIDKVKDQTDHNHFNDSNEISNLYSTKTKISNVEFHSIIQAEEKDQVEEMKILKNKYNINKEIKIQLINVENDIPPILEKNLNSVVDIGKKINKLVEENVENYSKRCTRKQTQINNKNKEIQSNNKNYKLYEKKKLTNSKQNLDENRKNVEKHLNIKRINNLAEPEKIDLSVELVNNINLINDVDSDVANHQKSENTENIKINSIVQIQSTPKIQKFFRGQRSNNVSNTNQYRFRLAKNIESKQTMQKHQTKNIKTKAKKVEETCSFALEKGKKRQTEKNKGIDQVIENIENIKSINNSNNPKSETEVNNNNKQLADVNSDKSSFKEKHLNRKRKNNLPEPENIIHKNLNMSDISAILEDDFDDDINSESNKLKKIYKCPASNRKVVTGNSNVSNIFDFQSSQSDDENQTKLKNEKLVIDKLVKQGKVQVAKYKMGTGRLKLKPIKKIKKKNPIKSIKIDNILNIQSQNHIRSKLEHNITDQRFVDIDHTPNKINVGFSPLARSAMRKNAEEKITVNNNIESRKRLRVIDKKKLLEAAKAFLNRSNNMTKANNISIPTKPITRNNNILIPTPPTFNASTPWRTPNLAHHFNYVSASRSNLNNNEFSFTDKLMTTKLSHENDNLQSINLSNIENVQPENIYKILETNPRKGLTNRSPLKNINILEVIHLPPLARENLYQYKSNTPAASPSENKAEFDSLADIFNLDEFVTDTDRNSELPIPRKRNLMDKLKKLNRLLPEKKTDSLSKPSRISLNTIKKIYKSNSPVKQKNIRELLCSTRINENTQNDFTINETEDEKLDETGRVNELHLFDDLTEGSTLNLNSTIRTYTRIKKRKKMRHQFITCLSSESEEEEDEDENIPKKRPKYGTEKEDKINQDKLKSFYTEFNSVIEDVNKYKLIVVPETTTN